MKTKLIVLLLLCSWAHAEDGPWRSVKFDYFDGGCIAYGKECISQFDMNISTEAMADMAYALNEAHAKRTHRVVSRTWEWSIGIDTRNYLNEK